MGGASGSGSSGYPGGLSGLSARWNPTLEGFAGAAFLELEAALKETYHGVTITRSDILWLLVQHFVQNTPDIAWTREQLRRGRTAKIDFRRRRSDAQFERELKEHEESARRNPGITGPDRPTLAQDNTPPHSKKVME